MRDLNCVQLLVPIFNKRVLAKQHIGLILSSISRIIVIFEVMCSALCFMLWHLQQSDLHVAYNILLVSTKTS